MKLDLRDNTCQDECALGLTIELGQECHPCEGDCATCFDEVDKCLSCMSPLVLTTDNVCDGACTNTNETVVDGRCVVCDAKCSACDGDADMCTACKSGFFLYENACQTECPDEWQPNTENACEYVGLQCRSGFELNEDRTGCVPIGRECQSGYKLNSDKTQCIPNVKMVPFPFIFVCVCFILIVIASKIKDRVRS